MIFKCAVMEFKQKMSIKNIVNTIRNVAGILLISLGIGLMYSANCSISKVYITPYGERYHYIATCGGKNSFQTTLDKAKSAGLTPCKKCTRPKKAKTKKKKAKTKKKTVSKSKKKIKI